MYSSSSYGATNLPLTNNPFIETASNPSNRYPDLSTLPSTQHQWTDQTLLTGAQQQYHPDIYQRYPQVQQQIPPGYPQQQPPFQSPQPQPPIQPLAPQPPQNYLYQPSQSQGPQPTTSFQPSSSYGQPSISGSSYGYLQSGQHQPPPQQTPSYNPAQQQIRNNPNYISQFDPLPISQPISQGWAANTTTLQSQPVNASPPNNVKGNFGYGNNQINSGPVGFSPTGISPTGVSHPRDYIRNNKQQIEIWDQYTWKQLLNSCEALKRAWESKRDELKGKLDGLQAQLRYAGYYDHTQIKQEIGRIQALFNDAQLNFDSTSTCTFQFDECHKGYRQSGDAPSKRRVREATNAALQNLPKWPEP